MQRYGLCAYSFLWTNGLDVSGFWSAYFLHDGLFVIATNLPDWYWDDNQRETELTALWVYDYKESIDDYC
jgi:hypothetical protein